MHRNGSDKESSNKVLRENDIDLSIHSEFTEGGDESVSFETPRAATKTGFYGRLFPYGFKGEIVSLFKLALPIMLTSLATNTVSTFSIMFCGHLGSIELAASGLANSVFNVTGLAVMFGLLTACDTLFSQTFGAGNLEGMGIQLQRGLFIISLSCLPCFGLYLVIEPILLGMGQNPVIARLVAEYMVILIPALLSATVYNLFTKYAQTQNIVIPPLIIGVIGNVTNAILHYVLLYHAGMGLTGSAMSLSISYSLEVVLILGYLYFSKVYKVTWSGYRVEMWDDWGVWFKLACPGLFMLGLQWWFFEVGTILTGTVGETELAAQTILLSLDGLLYNMIPLGLGTAAGIRVGQDLGAGNPIGPRSATSVALVAFFTGCISIAIILIGVRWELPKIYNTDPIVIATTAEVIPILAVFLIFDGMTGVFGGVLRGAGMQLAGAVIVFISLYCVAAPVGLSLLLATNMKLVGLWIGFLVGIFIAGVSYAFVYGFIDWDKQVELAAQRITNAELKREAQQTTKENSSSMPLKILTRGGFVAMTVGFLVIGACCKGFINWSDYFGIYCVFDNGTVVKHFTNENLTGLDELIAATGCKKF